MRPSVIVLLLILVICINLSLIAQSVKVPGVVVNHLAATTKTFIGSPSIYILPNGDYVASHDFFGPASTEHSQALTAIYKSVNKGNSWTKIAEVHGQFWSNLFIYQNDLYIMGTWKHHGNLIIRRSVDGGITWTEPVSGTTGLIREGEYHTAPMPMLIHNGRIWRAIENARSESPQWGLRYSAMMFSAPLGSDLLKADSWTETNYLTHNPAYLDGKFGGWIEGNAVLTPEGEVVDFLRVATSEEGQELAAMVKISNDGKTATFNPTSGFIDFAGGAKKFSIRFDPQSGRYWTINNKLSPEFMGKFVGSVRNTLVIKSSSDLKTWTMHKILLHHPDILKHGFQYVDWIFDGKDIIFLSRTAYDDDFGGADDYHNANYLTFHRIKNFRELQHYEIW